MKKIFSYFLVMMAALMFTLAVYQANQYISTSALVGPAISQIDEINNLGMAETLGASTEDLVSVRSSYLAMSNSILQSMLLDFVLGIVFLMAGYFTYSHKD